MSRPLHPCAVPTCPSLTRNTRCPQHTITREERNPRDPAQIKFYGSARWKQIRATVKLNQPICGMCHRVPTDTVHHIDGNWQNNQPENHQGVCDTCHRQHSGREHRKKRAS